jgi:hypothetical protein
MDFDLHYRSIEDELRSVCSTRATLRDMIVGNKSDGKLISRYINQEF